MMEFKSDTGFITEDFLLQTTTAKRLYHEYAREMPIIDYHNHLSPQQIADNKPLNNISEVWLSGDHYKWRAMRANGIDEKYISGNASPSEKFEKWAETVPYTVKNPLFHWSHLELKRHFNIDRFLQPSTASAIYQSANEVLNSTRPQDILKAMKVEVICTTDDPLDSLKYHQQIAEDDIHLKVLPGFRPDKIFGIESPGFGAYITRFSETVNKEITNLPLLLESLEARIEYFHDHGCRLSDYGLATLEAEEFTEKEVNEIFKKALQKKTVQPLEVKKYRSFMLLALARMYHNKNWVQQYHLGAIRDTNQRLKDLIGSDAGCDSIGEHHSASVMAKFFGTLDHEGKLAKTITYNLNPSQNEVFASMMGNFNSGESPGKMQWGSAWWFLDQQDGMEKQITTLSNLGLLSRFIGMLTDSRSLLSFPRHEYFRRILCNTIGDDIEKGSLPNDLSFFGKLVQNICYYNAEEYFNFEK